MSNIKDTADAIKGITEAIPVYEDMLQPATQELSKGLVTVAKTVNMVLAPLNGLVWGYERIAQYLEEGLSEKLKNTLKENIITPDPSVAGPAIENLRFSGHNANLRDMFTNLLATAMDKNTSQNAHPAFVEVIKQLNSDEAKIVSLLNGKSPVPLIKIRLYDKGTSINSFSEPLRNFSLIPFEAKNDYPYLGPSYLENIERLGLVNISYDVYDIAPAAYDKILSHSKVKEWESTAINLDKRFEVNQGAMTRTSFGKNFFDSCVTKEIC
ncbi:DUF4393 domain-containing protein [Metaplanococcus flavidus]